MTVLTYTKTVTNNRTGAETTTVLPWYFGDSASASRSADTSGVFEPNVYKVTNLEAKRTCVTSEESFITRFTPGYWSNKLETIQGPIGAIAFSNMTYDYSETVHDVQNQALLKAIAKVGQSDLSLGVELGELRETVQFITSPYKAARDVLTNPRHLSNLRKMLSWERGRGARKYLPRRALDNFSDSWMETRYALMPLVRSAVAIFEAMEEGLRSLSTDKIYTARAKVVGESRTSGSVVTGTSVCYINFPYKLEFQHVGRAFVHYRFTEVPTLASMLGLSPGYIPETAWDLLSLSFVMDWFLNIGDIIGALRIKTGIEILGNCVGVKTIGTGITTPYPTNDSWDYQISHGEFEHEAYSREINVTPSYLPDLNVAIKLSNAKLLDLVIILKNLIKR